MAESPYLVSTIVTGIALFAIALAVTGNGRWRRWGRMTSRPAADERFAPDRAARRATPWTAVYAMIALALGVGVVAIAGGLAAGLPVQQSAGLMVAVVGATVVLAFLLWGTYGAMRSRGFGSAGATMVSAWVTAAIVIAAIVVKLVTTA